MRQPDDPNAPRCLTPQARYGFPEECAWGCSRDAVLILPDLAPIHAFHFIFSFAWHVGRGDWRRRDRLPRPCISVSTAWARSWASELDSGQLFAPLAISRSTKQKRFQSSKSDVTTQAPPSIQAERQRPELDRCLGANSVRSLPLATPPGT